MVDLQSEQDERGQRVLTCVLFPQQSLDDANNSIGVCMCVCVCLYLCMCLSVLHGIRVCTYKFTEMWCECKCGRVGIRSARNTVQKLVGYFWFGR